ncbi:MAG: hypothetical protein N2C14_06420, partial [Planctomycetales bacterium]
MEAEKRKEDAANRKLTQIGVAVGATFVIMLLGLIVYNNLIDPTPPEDDGENVVNGDKDGDGKNGKGDGKDGSGKDGDGKNGSGKDGGKSDPDEQLLDPTAPIRSVIPGTTGVRPNGVRVGPGGTRVTSNGGTRVVPGGTRVVPGGTRPGGTRIPSTRPGGTNPTMRPGGSIPSAGPALSANFLEDIYSPDAPQHPSPTNGAPMELKYLANGPQMFLMFRPADLLKSPEGGKVWEALGPYGIHARETIESVAGVPLEEVEQVLIGLIDNGGSAPKMTMVARTSVPVSMDQLVAAWGNPARTQIKDRVVYQARGVAYYAPPAGGGQLIAMGPADQAEEILGEDEVFLRAEIQQMMDKTDASRQFTAVFAPQFPFSGGRAMFDKKYGDRLPVLKDAANAIARIQGRAYAKAALVSLHVDPAGFHTEFRVQGDNDFRPNVVAQDMHQKLSNLPEQVFEFYSPPAEGDSRPRFIPSPHTFQLIARYPKMLQAWAAYLRAGIDGKQAVLTSTLPAKAAHNLILASQVAVRDPGILVSGGPSSD